MLRRHGDPLLPFVYDLDVAEKRWRHGIGTALMRKLEQYARERGIREGFVLTNESNEPAMAFYRALGGARTNPDDVMFDFEY